MENREYAVTVRCCCDVSYRTVVLADCEKAASRKASREARASGMSPLEVEEVSTDATTLDYFRRLLN